MLGNSLIFIFSGGFVLLLCIGIIRFFRNGIQGKTDQDQLPSEQSMVSLSPQSTRGQSASRGFDTASSSLTDVSFEEKVAYTKRLTDEEFENELHCGPLGCDGLQCNRDFPCSQPERLFCRDIISKVISKDFFRGQYSLDLDDAVRFCSTKVRGRRIDFAIKGPSGIRLAVEMDGYTTHCKDLEPKDFDDHLARQNELTLMGWTFLRFSFYQMLHNSVACQNVIRAMLHEGPRAYSKTPFFQRP